MAGNWQNNQLALRLGYTVQFSEHAESHSASLKLSTPFKQLTFGGLVSHWPAMCVVS